nr:hypothetical protein [Butyrivibrio sp.]
FMKSKQCLEIGKIQFSFVDSENPKNHIDVYMSAEEFGALLMSSVKNGFLFKALISEKGKGDKYPKAVWVSPIGGNGTGNNGKPISRYFEISPSTTSEVLFTAYCFPAERSSTGAFIKIKGSKPLFALRVACSFNDLKILQYKWSFLESDYMSKKYSLKNMTQMRSQEGPDKKTDTPISEQGKEKTSTNSFSYNSGDDDVPFVGTDNTKPSNDKENLIETKMATIKLVATSVLETVPGKNIKVCHVTEDSIEKRLICLMDKIADSKKFEQFENQLYQRVSSKHSLEFKAEVVKKGNDLYFTKFA